MINELYSLPEYDVAFRSAVQTLNQSALRASCGVLRDIRFVEKEELSDTQLGPRGESVVHGRSEIESDLGLDVRAILGAEFARPFQDLLNGAESRISELEATLFQHVGAVCDVVGQTVCLEKPGLNLESLPAKLKKVHIEFDEDGEPLLERLSLAIFQNGRSQKVRYLDCYAVASTEVRFELDEIVRVRKESHLASRPLRRLPRRSF